MVFNATFKNISAISWWLVLLVGKTGVLSTPSHQRGSNTTLVVISTDCTENDHDGTWKLENIFFINMLNRYSILIILS